MCLSAVWQVNNPPKCYIWLVPWQWWSRKCSNGLGMWFGNLFKRRATQVREHIPASQDPETPSPKPPSTKAPASTAAPCLRPEESDRSCHCLAIRVWQTQVEKILSRSLGLWNVSTSMDISSQTWVLFCCHFIVSSNYKFETDHRIGY